MVNKRHVIFPVVLSHISVDPSAVLTVACAMALVDTGHTSKMSRDITNKLSAFVYTGVTNTKLKMSFPDLEKSIHSHQVAPLVLLNTLSLSTSILGGVLRWIQKWYVQP